MTNDPKSLKIAVALATDIFSQGEYKEKIETAIQDCMRPPGAQSAGAKNAHGYRAQYQICVANVHRQFGKFGH